MSAPGAPPGGMGGMSQPSGELSEQLAQMMGNNSGAAGGNKTAGPGSGPAGAAQAAQAQQLAGGQPKEPRPVGTFADEFKTGITDIFQGIKEFFNINTWLGVNPDKLDPQQQAHAKQLHSRYQQLDQEQQSVARRMFEEKMQRQKMQQQEEAQRKQREADQKAQSIEMPSSPKKGAEGPGGGKSKKQNVMTKMKQDRTTLNNTQGE